ncbi:uncharacterized protein TRIVIDRAFT_191874 [Trichoderma virens Gv29-8]|uniref:Zn(2)-C6 fungal-type domain-containing protein n=1 Tax=Hypocrea virens (strain Gv29-8 / FGSC 10586) TaxID=413071 RepID=G9MUM0_HYPVG|nr:uncharacterized protein TRIVIDRAFT_191874 [Trichoderma virens Gv29-8]EHK21861.1 hypothetical protein TRIVIDRAFT_191874 [Trichoderma virens Gv29-8]
MDQFMPPGAAAAAIKIPRRAYQACVRCRQRKARCLIPDPPPGADPVCMRCKRERKECVFTAERSRKQSSRHNESPLSDLTDRVTRTVVSNQSEALNLLFEAAEVYHAGNSAARTNENDVGSLNASAESNSVQTPGRNSAWHSKGWEWAYPAENVVQPSPEVIETFARLKFVKKRWLTAQEAVTFVNLFFRNMCPITPVIGDWYGDPANYRNLVDAEPVLCTAILTLSSRYHLLHGDGWLSRSYFLHNRLWRYCQSLLQRVIWGQEKGIVSSARSLGTVEGFLLMAERSDRMSWSLIQSAASVGHELGLFDDEGDNDSSSGSSIVREFNKQRRQRLRIVLYLYMNQLAFRIGFSTLIPHTLVSLSQNALKQSPTSQLGDYWIESMSLWVDLSRLTRTSHDLLFASKALTRELVQSGRYRRILDHFKPLLENWWAKYTAATGVIVAAKDVLRIILGFAEIGRLRYLPVRTYVRVISSCIFLLKALALGVPTDELNASLGLIDQSARVLRLHIVDDLHLAGIFASLLETYTQGFRERFVSILGVSRPTNSHVLDTEGFPGSEHAANEMPAIDLTGGDYGINQDWLAHPFDASIAPFGAGLTQTFGVFDDELNFIWNENL